MEFCRHGNYSDNLTCLMNKYHCLNLDHLTYSRQTENLNLFYPEFKTLLFPIAVNTTVEHCVGLLLGQRLRRWLNINPTQGLRGNLLY